MNAPETAYFGKHKYDTPRANAYQRISPRKNRAEMALVDRALATMDAGSLLDLPCGGGRVALRAARCGFDVTAADVSEAMLAITRANAAALGADIVVERQDIECLEYADRSFDHAICFRLFHHFPTVSLRRRVVQELCRTTRQCVAVSYFSPWSVTSLRRRTRAALTGVAPRKHACSLDELRRHFASAGFRLVGDHARARFVRSLHLAVFERVPHQP